MSNDNAGFGTPESLTPNIAMFQKFFLEFPLSVAIEGLQFGSRRLQAQADYLASLTRCTSVPDAMKAHSEFASKAMSDYQSEAAVLIRETQDSIMAKAA